MRFFASLVLVSPLLATVACSAPSSFDNAAGPAQLARADRKQHVVAAQPPRYLTLPPTPHLPRPDVETRLGRPDGASIWYAQYWPTKSKAAKKAKVQPPVVFLHGGLAASQWLGHQIAHFKETRHVIAIDSRAQGRSTNGNGTLLTYDTMTEDVVAILDHLKISTAALVGWSDGAIIGLDFALNHPSRIDRVFAFAPNYNISGTLDVSVSPVFTEYEARAQKIYEKINPTHDFEIQYDAVTTMWATLPAWNQKDFEAIPSDVGRRIWIVDGDHEEAVRRYQIDDLANWIKESGELLLPQSFSHRPWKMLIFFQTSHFAFMQDPSLFNDAIQRLLDITF